MLMALAPAENYRQDGRSVFFGFKRCRRVDLADDRQLYRRECCQQPTVLEALFGLHRLDFVAQARPERDFLGPQPPAMA